VPPGTRKSWQPNDALRIDDYRKLHENNGIQRDRHVRRFASAAKRL